jgi:SAM-dependent methyltransferase
MDQDFVGRETLRLLARANKYTQLSAQEIGRHLRGKILELGAGTGNLTQHLAFSNEITALDINTEYLEDLKHKIQDLERKTSRKAKPFAILQADLTAPPKDALINRYDTLLSCQVLEHLPDDLLVLTNYVRCLKPGGRVVLQLPAHAFAFCSLDQNLGHFRRYSRKSAEDLVTRAGVKVEKSYYYNFFGLLGWLWAGKILRKKMLPDKELALFNSIAPFVLKLDILFSKFLGLNVIVVARKA